MFHVGIDAHQKYSSICIVSDEGEVVSRGDVRSREEDLHRFLDGFEDLRIVLECSSSSPANASSPYQASAQSSASPTLAGWTTQGGSDGAERSEATQALGLESETRAGRNDA